MLGLALGGLLVFGFLESSHVQTVASATAQLSAELRRPITVDRSLAKIPILFCEPTRTPIERLTDLASALHAGVVRDGSFLRIERSTTDRQKLAEIHRDLLRKRIESALTARAEQRLRSSLLGDRPTQVRLATEAVQRAIREANEAKAEGRTFTLPVGLIQPDFLTPAGQLAFELLRKLGATRLSNLRLGEVQYLSNHPNSAELPLPECADLLATYLKAQDQTSVAVKLILRLDEFGATLQVFARSGNRMDSSGLDYANQTVVGAQVRPSGVPGKGALPLSPSAFEMAAFLDKNITARMDALAQSEKARSTLSPPARPDVPEAFLHPEIRDPLDFAVREAFAVILQDRKRDGYIAVLTDWPIELVDDCTTRGELDTRTFRMRLLQEETGHPSFEFVSKGKQTFLRPKDLSAGEAQIADRTALGKAIRRIIDDRRIDIRNWSSLGAAMYPSFRSPVEQRYVKTILTLGLRCPLTILSVRPEWYAVIGTALTVEKREIDAGASPFRELLRDGLNYGWLTLKSPPRASDLSSSPSSILASGALNQAKLLLLSNETTVVDNASGSDLGFVGGPPLQNEVTRLYPAIPMKRTEERTKSLFEIQFLRPRYRIGRRTDIQVELRLRDGQVAEVKLTDSFLEKTGISFQGLPKEFQNGFLDAVRRGLQQEGTPIPALDPGDKILPPK